MSVTDSPSVKRRKAGHGRPPPDAGRMTLSKALRGAVVKSAEAAVGLGAVVTSVRETRTMLAGFCETVAPASLLALLEGPQSAFALAVLETQTLAALIEMQTTGRVIPRPAEPRPPTRTDAVLSADFLDTMLEEFERRTAEAGLAVAPAVAGFRYAVPLADTKALTLTLEDQPYRHYELGLDLADGAKSGRMSLLFPVDPPRAGESGDGGALWEQALHASLDGAQVSLHAVLARKAMTLREIAGLVPGALVTLPREVLDKVQLEDLNGAPVSPGRLGRQGNWRAVRVSGEPDSSGVARSGLSGHPVEAGRKALSDSAAERATQVETSDQPDTPAATDMTDLPRPAGAG
jgi:flagellar motor switch protein FliM